MTKTTKIIIGVVIVIIAIILIVVFSGQKPKEEVIKAGVIAPLTGDFASYGEYMQRGVELAKEEINNSGGIGGKKIKIVFEDACLPKDTLTAINKLVAIDNIEFVSGTFCLIGVLPILTVTEPEKMPVMITASVPDNIIEAGDYVFSTNIAIKDEARAQAEFTFQKLGAKTASILYLNTDWGISYYKNFQKYFTELGGKILNAETFIIGDNDFRSQLTKTKNLNPDVLVVEHSGNTMGILLNQAKELGIKSPIIGNYEAEDPVILKVAPESAEGFIISAPTTLEKTIEEEQFERKFKEEFNIAPTLLAKNAYDGLKLMAEIFARCDGNRECIKTDMYKVNNYPGVSGKFSISQDGTAIKDIIFKIVKNGQFVPYEE